MRDPVSAALGPLLALGLLTLVRSPLAAAAASPEETVHLYLQVFINGIDQELVVHVERRADELYIDPGELEELRLNAGTLPSSGGNGIALRNIQGVQYRYDAPGQRLDLTVDPALMQPSVLGYGNPLHGVPHSDVGLVFDYAVHLQEERVDLLDRSLHEQRHRPPLMGTGYGPLPIVADDATTRAYEERNQTLAFDSDVRVFSPYGLFVNNGYATSYADESAYIRTDTYWTYSTLDSMRSYTIGDFINGSLAWTRAIRMGGARVARNFTVRPDLVTFPTPYLGGTALVPTTVDLYVHGVRQFSGHTPAGPFVITDPPALTGAGTVSIIYQDALGREVATAQRFYVDARLMGDGLSDYAFEVGYPRRNYGSESSDYGDDPAGTASLRYGVNDAFTLEGHGEVAHDLVNLGVGSLFGLGRFGVVNAAIGFSDGDGQGTLTSVGYQYISRIWSIDVSDRRVHDEYRDIGSLEGIPLPSRLSRVALSMWLADGHALSGSYAEQEDSFSGNARIASLGYNGSWFQSRVSVHATAFKDLDDEEGDGAYVGVSVGFGGRASVFSSYSRQGSQETATLGASRPVDYDLGGFGYTVLGERGSDDYSRVSGRLDYRTRFGDWAAIVERASMPANEYTNAALYGTGSLVYMNGELLAGRTIYDGFALVSTSGIPDIPVKRENRLLGRTNKNGYLLVPDLPSYRTSQLAIDPLGLPVDVDVATDQMLANPRERSGILVEFPLGRFRGATVVLEDEAGDVLLPGTPVTLLGTGERMLVGYDGQVFFPTLNAANRISAQTEEGRCEADVTFDSAQSMQVIGPFVCSQVPDP